MLKYRYYAGVLMFILVTCTRSCLSAVLIFLGFFCAILCRCIDVHFSNVYKKLLECSTDISGFFLCSAFVHKVH